MNKVVSIALFGNVDKKDGSGVSYADYLTAFVLAHHNIYLRSEDWDLAVHTDVVSDRLRQLSERGLIRMIVRHDPAPLTEAMLWRMDPVFVGTFDYVFCRDLDAPPMPRDRACMEQFMASGADVHTIHDAPVHVGIMGGLCGFQTKTFRAETGLDTLTDLYKFAGNVDWAQHGTDQHVLNRLVASTPGLTLLEHRYNGWWKGAGAKPPHKAGVYRCKAFTTKVPDVGHDDYPWARDSITADGKYRLFNTASVRADHLGAHLGCAGYDHKAARAFWEEHGTAEITRLVKECEG